MKELIENIFNKETTVKGEVAKQKQEIINNLLKQIKEEEYNNETNNNLQFDKKQQ